MNRLLIIRYALREVLIPSLVGLAGVFLSLYLPLTDRLEYWHLPLLAGMIGTPLVAIGGSKDPPAAPTPPPLPEPIE